MPTVYKCTWCQTRVEDIRPICKRDKRPPLCLRCSCKTVRVMTAPVGIVYRGGGS